MRGNRWALLLPLATVVIQGFHTIVSKMSAGLISPESISCYRLVVAVVILTPMLLGGLIREWPVVRQNLGRLLLLSFLGLVIYQALVYVAARTTTATNIAIIGSLVPLVTVGWAALLLRFRPGPLVLGGCALSLIGVVVLIEHGNPIALFSQRVEIGDIEVLAGVAAYALYGALLRRWQIPLTARTLFFAQVLLATLITVPGPLIWTASPITWANGWLVLAAAILGSVTAPFLWMMSMQRVGPVTSALFINLSPLITVGLAIAFLGENVEIYHAVGAALTIGGVLVAQSEALRKSRPQPEPAPAARSAS